MSNIVTTSDYKIFLMKYFEVVDPSVDINIFYKYDDLSGELIVSDIKQKFMDLAIDNDSDNSDSVNDGDVV